MASWHIRESGWESSGEALNLTKVECSQDPYPHKSLMLGAQRSGSSGCPINGVLRAALVFKLLLGLNC